MLALGIITLFLTAFMLGYYGYINRHDEVADVSFFMSVGLISMVLNLFTNAAGGNVLSWVYLVVDLAFLGLGFAVSTEHSIGFYKSLGPWCVSTFTNKALIGWQLLSFFCFPAGIALYFVWGKEKPELSLECGKMSVWGILFWAILLWTILGIVL